MQSELFNYLEKDIRSLDIYQSIFNSMEPEVIDGSRRLTSLEKGICISLYDDMRIESIVLHSKGVNFQQYQETLPAGLSFDFRVMRNCAGQGKNEGVMDAMDQAMTPPKMTTNEQIDKAVAKYRALLEKHAPNWSASAAPSVRL